MIPPALREFMIATGCFAVSAVVFTRSESISSETLAAVTLALAGTTIVTIAVMYASGAYARRPAALALRAGLIFYLLAPGIQVSLSGSSSVFTTDLFHYAYKNITVDQSHFASVLFYVYCFYLTITLVELLFGSSRRPSSGPRRASVSVEGRARYYRKLLASCTVLITLALTLLVLLSGGNPVKLIEFALAGRTGQAPWSSQGLSGGAVSTLRNLAIATIVGSAGIVFALALVARRRVSRRLLTVALALSVPSLVLVVLESGTRNQLVLAILPAALAVATGVGRDGDPAAAKTRPSPRTTLIFVALVPLLMIVSSLIAQFRVTGDAPDSFTTLDTNSNDFYAATALAVAIEEESGSQFESPLALSVVQVVPAPLYPGTKPYSPSTVRFTQAKWGLDPRQGSQQAFGSIVGQYLMAYGLLGPVIAGLLFSLSGRALDGWASRRGTLSLVPIVPLSAAAFLFVSFRGLFGAFFLPCLVTLAIHLMAVRGSGPKRPRPSPGLIEARA